MCAGNKEAPDSVNHSVSDESPRQGGYVSAVRRALGPLLVTSLVAVPGLVVIFREPEPLWRVYAWGFLAGWFGGTTVLTLVRSVADWMASRAK